MKRSKRVFEYTICGRLASGCLHISRISREAWCAMVRRYKARIVRSDYAPYHNRVADLPITSSKYLHRGYCYQTVDVTVICYKG